MEVFQDRVLRRLFGHERVEVTGGWRKLRGEELCNISSTVRNISQEGLDGRCV
jgi:hypothetical protein